MANFRRNGKLPSLWFRCNGLWRFYWEKFCDERRDARRRRRRRASQNGASPSGANRASTRATSVGSGGGACSVRGEALEAARGRAGISPTRRIISRTTDTWSFSLRAGINRCRIMLRWCSHTGSVTWTINRPCQMACGWACWAIWGPTTADQTRQISCWRMRSSRPRRRKAAESASEILTGRRHVDRLTNPLLSDPPRPRGLPPGEPRPSRDLPKRRPPHFAPGEHAGF